MLNVSSVACGTDHTCVLTDSGRVFTWGGGSRGQLGHGDNRDLCAPRCVSALRRRVKQISAGAYHSLALMAGGSVYAWGGGEVQLGLPKGALRFWMM